jgi:hypothetical protein
MKMISIQFRLGFCREAATGRSPGPKDFRPWGSSTTTKSLATNRNRPAASLLSERHDAENPVSVTIRTTGEEQLIVQAVRTAVLTELQRPNVRLVLCTF